MSVAAFPLYCVDPDVTSGNFLGVSELACSQTILCPFVSRSKWWTHVWSWVTILSRKISGWACKRQRRSAQISTGFCFSSYVNILGIQCADTLFITKSPDTIRYTVIAWIRGLNCMSDSQTSAFFQHVISNMNVFGTCCIFGASWAMLILDTVSPTFELG